MEDCGLPQYTAKVEKDIKETVTCLVCPPAPWTNFLWQRT